MAQPTNPAAVGMNVMSAHAAVQGGDKTSHWSAGEVLSAAE